MKICLNEKDIVYLSIWTNIKIIEYVMRSVSGGRILSDIFNQYITSRAL